jgi:hypothetical protein
MRVTRGLLLHTLVPDGECIGRSVIERKPGFVKEITMLIDSSMDVQGVNNQHEWLFNM